MPYRLIQSPLNYMPDTQTASCDSLKFEFHQVTDKMSDAQWLRQQRAQFGMSQSNIVSYLEITTWQNVNPGRIAEVETGQRNLPSLWREKLEPLFEYLQQSPPSKRSWRNHILTGQG